MKIPFNKPYISENEYKYIKDAIDRGKFSGDGYYTKRVSQYFEEQFGCKKALMMTSCSSALDMACLIIELKEDDEVILPSYTFVSTANAVVLRKAKCIFAEVDEFLNLDLNDVERKITSKTKAVIPVHYASTSCDMDRLMAMSFKYGFYVIEDAAQAINAKYKDRFLGTIGHMGCYSFHETKNIVCGEGGALLINSLEQSLIEKAEIAREKGTNRSKFYRGEVDKYSWVDVGSSYLPSDMLSAFLMAQLEKRDEITSLRGQAYNRYHTRLEELEKAGVFRRCIIPNYNHVNYHMYYIILNSEKERDSLMVFLKTHGINAVFHYLPLHTSEMGRRLGYHVGDLMFTEEVSKCLLRLPLFASITNEEIDYISNLIFEWSGNIINNND